MHYVLFRMTRCFRPSIGSLPSLFSASRKMASAPPSASALRTYNDAIDSLNSLQTPFAIIEARRKAGIRPDAQSLEEMKGYLARIGYTPKDLDKLNVIHVAGTKGKGSTCAFVDSILGQYRRRHGVPRKVGLFTSPHLIAVRERIRINSAPISEELFARYFFEVWDALESSEAGSTTADAAAAATAVRGEEGEPRLGSTGKPIYARFLTLLSWHAFLREGVDAAVYETGIGGAFDATNAIERPLAAGISTLGIDHVFALGDTVAKIAWHKAGIMKPGCPAFSVAQEYPDAADVLRARAREIGDVDLVELPAADPRLRGVAIRPDAVFQRKNATLAIALAEAALSRLDWSSSSSGVSSFVPNPEAPLPVEFRDGLEQVVWRGRCEVKPEPENGVTWHVDGAHTVDSLKMAARWFVGECEKRPGPKALIFNQQGRQEAVSFLEGLCNTVKSSSPDGVGFQYVIFCSNVTYAETGYKRDFVNHQYNPADIQKLTMQHAFAEKWRSLDPTANVLVVPSIEEAINTVRGLGSKSTTTTTGEKGGEGERQTQTVQALITGSLHLVGGALGILEKADAL